MVESLKGEIRNPQIYVDEREAHCMSQIADADDRREIIGKPDESAELPIDHVIDRETMRVWLKGLVGRDRKMFRMMLKGASNAEIAKEFGLAFATANHRCNGLLWQARCRADLAEYFDCEPGEMPEMRNNHYPTIAAAAPCRKIA